MHLAGRISGIIALAVLLFPPCARGELREAADAYEITASVAVSVLPPPLGDFFLGHLGAVQRSATAGLGGGSAGDTLPGQPEWHYVTLDAAADGMDQTSRLAAARSFPHDRAAALRLFKRVGHRGGGLLPWIVLKRCEMLEQAFRAGKGGKIVREAGTLIHFATDASLPFNTTTDRDGRAAGCVRWSSTGRSGDAEPSHRTVRHRLQNVLIHRLRKRLDYEARVSPDRYTEVASPIAVVFDALLDAHQSLGVLAAVDVEATTALGVADAKSFAAASDSYYSRVADRAADIIEQRLEAAGLLAAKLIGAAWVRAGSPSPGKWTAETPRMVSNTRTNDKPDYAFVGSRSSNVFHRITCSHAKRIRPANRIYFDGAEAARTAGRVPCRSCRPSASQP